MKRSDWVVLALVVAGSIMTAALGARIAGAELMPWVVFALVVLDAPIPLLLAILPQFGVRSVVMPSVIENVPVPPPPGHVTAVAVATPPEQEQGA